MSNIKTNTDEDVAPAFKSWRTWYTLVIVILALLIVSFQLFTKYFS
ncbi:hypothetical protein QEG73_14590 [Chitinophagaceae bacterium 26-R-25]|nr:hypothetical protein [Chitinophagaceae bacterium 26-R-25]